MSRRPPFSDGSDFTSCRSAAVNTPLRRTTEEITNQMGVNVFGSAPHVFLFEARDSFTDGRFDFTLRLQGTLRRAPLWIDESPFRDDLDRLGSLPGHAS
jgi:hypothetical protein